MSNSNTTVTPAPIAPVAVRRIENADIESGNMFVVLYGAITELLRGFARWCRVFSRTAEVADDKVKTWQDGVAANADLKQELAIAEAQAGQQAIRDQIAALQSKT